MTVGDDPSRSDLKLWEQALRGDYPIPPAVKRRMLQIAMDLIDPPDPIPPENPPTVADGEPQPEPAPVPPRPSHRTQLAALRVLGQFSRIALEQAKLDFIRDREAQRAADGKPADNVAEVLRDFLSLPADPGPDRPATRPNPEARASLRGDGG